MQNNVAIRVNGHGETRQSIILDDIVDDYEIDLTSDISKIKIIQSTDTNINLPLICRKKENDDITQKNSSFFMNLYSKYIYNLYGDNPNVVKYLTYADRLYTFYITLYLNFEGHTESSINKSFSKFLSTSPEYSLQYYKNAICSYHRIKDTAELHFVINMEPFSKLKSNLHLINHICDLLFLIVNNDCYATNFTVQIPKQETLNKWIDISYDPSQPFIPNIIFLDKLRNSTLEIVHQTCVKTAQNLIDTRTQIVNAYMSQSSEYDRNLALSIIETIQTDIIFKMSDLFVLLPLLEIELLYDVSCSGTCSDASVKFPSNMVRQDSHPTVLRELPSYIIDTPKISMADQRKQDKEARKALTQEEDIDDDIFGFGINKKKTKKRLGKKNLKKKKKRKTKNAKK